MYRKVVLAAVVTSVIAGALDSGPQSGRLLSEVHADQTEMTFVLDVGAAGDDDTAADMHLDTTSRISDPHTDGERTWRELDENSYLYFRVRASSFSLSPIGVPMHDAVLEVTFRDTVDEQNCSNVKSTRAYCRPRVSTLLNYGDEPSLTWLPIGGLGGLADGEWKVTQVFLEAVPWQTLRAIDGYFEFYVQYPNQMEAYDPLPIDEIALRFVSSETFDIEREAERADRSLIRSDYVEGRSIDPAYPRQPFLLFAPNYLEKVYPNTVPRPEWVVDTLRAFEVPGESEPITFGVYAFESLDGMTVQVSDLVSARGTIAASAAGVHLVGVLDKRWGYSYDRYYGSNPWFLDDERAFNVPAGQSRQVWITFEVPDNAVPGRYTGEITVSGSGGTESMGLELEVLDVDLAPPDATPYVYHSPFLRSKHFAPQRLTAVRNMAEHGLNPIIYLDAEIDLFEYRVDVRDLHDELSAFQSLGILPPEPRVGISDNVSALWRQLCPGVPIYEQTCGDFDAAYVHVLRQYRDAFAEYGVTPALSFTDEPGTDPARRIRSNYLHRLTRMAEMRTWVTYYPRCEEALAGHEVSFSDMSGGISPRMPDWLLSDASVRGHWDFTDGTMDRSLFANDGELAGSAEIRDGVLEVGGGSDYMTVAHDEALNLTDEGTVYLWLKPEKCPSDYAWRPLRKYPGTEGANYVLYLFGDYDGKYPDNMGDVRMYADAGGWGAVSGTGRVECEGAPNAWYNVIWSYDAEEGGVLYLNGVAHRATRGGTLATNESPLLIGGFEGAVDEVMILGRKLTADEARRIALELNADYDRDQTITLSLDVADPGAMPSSLTFSLSDVMAAEEDFETLKSVAVDGQPIWSATTLDVPDKIVQLDLSGIVATGVPAVLSFGVTNRHARQEQLKVYFVEDEWRRANWVVDADERWTHGYVADHSGALGPMAPQLDDRVHAMRYVSGDAIDGTVASGDSFSYYTTYPATQPVIANNRFLNGVYASALGAEGVYVYAYGDWGAQPWDDLEPSYVERIGSQTAQRSQNNYQLVLPSWHDRLYDTLAHEALREGVEDSRVIATLKREIAANPGPLADEAQQFLDDLFSRVSRDYSPRYMSYDSAQPIEKYADRSGEFLTDLGGDPEAFGVFDAARLEMLRYIQSLRAPGHPRAVFLPQLTGP